MIKQVEFGNVTLISILSLFEKLQDLALPWQPQIWPPKSLIGECFFECL